MTPAALRHVVLSNPRSHGFQYGMLRDFEDEIVRITGAAVVPMPDWEAPSPIRSRLAHGTRYAPLRRYAPKQGGFLVDADVLWVVLMGPESSSLDLLRDWDRRVGYRIVYLYDTFESQLPSLRALLGAAKWDLCITSFHGAVPMLEQETGRPWAAVAQGVEIDRFAPVPAAERVIPWSSYGRRLGPIHGTIERWSAERGLHYDVTVAESLQREVDSRYLYRQYAWHLRHSWFTVCWPVELTHPARAGSLSPMTCRWFEAAAAETTIVGAPPKDPIFTELFGPDAVIPLDPRPASPDATREALEAIWSRREEHLARARALRKERLARWTWEARVNEILALAKLA